MKKYYLLSVLGLFMALTTTLAQPLREGATPTKPPALHTRKASAPFLGITVNIPLWKLLGKKKVKALPEVPKADVASYYEDERLPVSVEPMNLEMSLYSAVVVTPGLPNTSQSESEGVGCENCSGGPEAYAEELARRRGSGGYGYTGGCIGGCQGTGSGTDTHSQDQAPPGAQGGGNTDISHLIEEGANLCEIRYLWNNPSVALPLHVNRKTVERFIEDNFPSGNLPDTPFNAIKHALYQALNTCSIRTNHTRNLAALHEECDGERPSTQQAFAMDTHNNAVGIEIGSRWEVHGCSASSLVAMVLEAFTNGRLRKIDGQPTP